MAMMLTTTVTIGFKTTQFIVIFVPVATVIAIVAIGAKSNKSCKNGLSSEEKKSINRDDDKFYKFGVFYYNKNDPALFVEKRIGLGMTFNFARPAAKIVMGLISVLIGAMLIGMIFFMPGLTKERQVHVSQDAIKTEGVWGKEIKRQEINKIVLEDMFPRVLTRTNGAAINKKLYGWFKLQDCDRALLFIGNKTKPFIAIYLKDNSLVLINYEDEGKTTGLFNEILSKMNVKEASD